MVIFALLILAVLDTIAVFTSQFMLYIMFWSSLFGMVITLILSYLYNDDHWIMNGLKFNPSEPWLKAAFVCFVNLIICIFILCYQGW